MLIESDRVTEFRTTCICRKMPIGRDKYSDRDKQANRKALLEGKEVDFEQILSGHAAYIDGGK